ncbi:MAG: peptide ABC transporter substrate-binding protein [Chloroflexota bacterium]
MQKRLFGILASIVVIVAACGGANTSPAASTPAGSVAPGASTPAESAAPSISDMAETQVLKIDLHGEPPTLDPNKAQDSVSIAVLQGLSRPLVYFDKDLKVVDALAESHEISADAKTLTFHLRDAKYSNGDPIVAADLVFGWKRLLDPRTAAPYSYVMAEVAGAEDLLALAGADPAPSDADIQKLLDKLGVAAPDPKTFVVTLAKPATYFLSVMALWIAVPVQEKWITSPNATEAANYVSSGPYVLDTWSHNSQIILKPNPNWYGDQKSILTEIDMSMTTEPAQEQAAYEAGDLDMVLTPSEDAQRVKDDPTLGPTVLDVPQLAITYYTYNNGVDPKTLKTLKRCTDPKKCPTANKDFRIALTQAIDKKAFVDATFAGIGDVANSMIMPGIPGYQADLDPYPFDLAAAKEHMTTALAALGVASAADFGKLKFGFNSGSGHEPRVAFLAEAWRQAFGLQTEQIGSDFSVFLTQRTAGLYDLARDGWGADYPHANNQLGLFLCGGGNNDNQYCNKDFDALIAQAAGEADQDKQVALYNQAQTILMNDAAFLPLRFGLSRYEVQPYVGGLTVTPSDSQMPGDKFYETIYIKKH